MTAVNSAQPLVFEAFFMERIWGGRRLETRFRKRLPKGMLMGESRGIVVGPETQTLIIDGPRRSWTLQVPWMEARAEIFGDIPDTVRFRLFATLIDVR